MFKRKQKTDPLAELEKKTQQSIARIESATKGFEETVRKATHNAYAGIVCAVCGKNVFSNTGTWVHSDGKAYCLEPCWRDLHE